MTAGIVLGSDCLNSISVGHKLFRGQCFTAGEGVYSSRQMTPEPRWNEKQKASGGDNRVGRSERNRVSVVFESL